MYTLTHHDDGKEKCQSHIIELQVRDIGDYPAIFNVEGYGSTKEEAISDFKKDFEKAIVQINYFYKELDYSNVVDIDCVGRILK